MFLTLELCEWANLSLLRLLQPKLLPAILRAQPTNQLANLSHLSFERQQCSFRWARCAGSGRRGLGQSWLTIRVVGTNCLLGYPRHLLIASATVKANCAQALAGDPCAVRAAQTGSGRGCCVCKSFATTTEAPETPSCWIAF